MSGYRFVQPLPGLLFFGQIGLLLCAVVRGLNYFATPTGSTPTLMAIERSSAGGIWGWLFIGFGAAGAVAELAMFALNTNRAWIVSFLCHAALFGLYISSAVAAGYGILQREPFYGFTAPVELVMFAVAHVLFVRARRAR